MEITITPAEMKQRENDFMTRYGIPGSLLMEHAAQGIVAAVARHTARNALVLFLCGPGNNGGDGYAAARLWQAQGGRSVIWEMLDNVSGDALLNRHLAILHGIQVENSLDKLPPLLECGAIVDALFGTGLSRFIGDPVQALICAVNASGRPVIAVDIPSGIDGLTGQIRALEAIRATETVTFHRIKQGLLLRDAPSYTGKITIHPILIPDGLEHGLDGLFILTPQDLAYAVAPRDPNCHKGDFGRIVIYAGSEGMAGAAAFCASACVKAGAGLTTILCRQSILHTLQALVPEAMCKALPEENGHLLPAAAEIARDALSRAQAACIGCGLGQSEDNMMILRAFRAADCPVVWDADALNLLSRHDGLLPLKEQDVITPHPGEASRLLDQDTEEILEAPLAALDALHELCGCTVVLKGARTLISNGIVTYVNRFASPALAKGGSGDVLAGIITALLVHTEESALADAALGVLIHGLAGIRAEKESGENCVTPSLLIRHIRLDNKNL